MKHSTSIFLLSTLAATSCAHMIPGTEINDNPENRAILALIEKYRRAFEERDADTIAALADPTFFDDAGTTTPYDDWNYKDLKTKLAERLKRLEDVRLNIAVRSVTPDKENRDMWRATYTFSTSFRMPSLLNGPQNETDIKQMLLKRGRAGEFTIVSGL